MNAPPPDAIEIQAETLRGPNSRMRTQSQILTDGVVAWVGLTRGLWAIIDFADVPLIEGRAWHSAICNGRVYASSVINNHPVRMHRALFGPVAKGKLVDHKDGDGLNNRRQNIRKCNPTENCRNAKISKNNTLGIKGVSPCTKSKFYRARIRVMGQQIHLGTFATPELAHEAYKAAADKLFGDFAKFA